jgi:hypothetical protein
MLSINIPSKLYPYIKQFNTKNFDIMDGFYARLLINISGLIDYVKVHDNSGSHTPMALGTSTPKFYGMNQYSIFNLIEEIRQNKIGKPFENLRHCFDQTGFLIFVDDYENVFVYAEDFINFESWLSNAIKEGPSSRYVLNN